MTEKEPHLITLAELEGGLAICQDKEAVVNFLYYYFDHADSKENYLKAYDSAANRLLEITKLNYEDAVNYLEKVLGERIDADKHNNQ